LSIPPDPSPQDIIGLVAKIDELNSILNFKYTLVKSERARLRHLLNVTKKRLLVQFKDQAKNRDECEALAIDHIASHGLGGYADPFDVLATLEEQCICLEGLLGILEDKRRLLISCLGSMKLEAGLSALEGAARTLQ
jgi:hypothetical protein